LVPLVEGELLLGSDADQQLARSLEPVRADEALELLLDLRPTDGTVTESGATAS
jgi:hypothetical protein